MLKTSLGLGTKGSLKLTPSINSSLNILASSNTELNELVSQALNENFLLESLDASEDILNQDLQDQDSDAEADFRIEEDFSLDSIDMKWEDVVIESDYAGSDYLEEAKDFAELYLNRDSELSFKNYLAKQFSEFIWQNELEETLAFLILENIDEATGYLTLDDESMLEEIQRLDIFDKNTKAKITLRCICKLIKKIQKEFEPTGVATYNHQESLLLQLAVKINANQNNKQQEDLLLAQDMVLKFYSKLFDRDFLEQTYNKSLISVFKILSQLNHNLTNEFNNLSAQIINPDLVLSIKNKENIKDEDDYFVLELVNSVNLAINQEYLNLIKVNKKTLTANELEKSKEQLMQAKDLISAIKFRGASLLIITNYILKHQLGFFTQDSSLKPLSMSDIALELELNVSTVSRTIKGKYIQTSKGIFELKSFLSTGIEVYGQEDYASSDIKERISNLIKQEPATKPLSDTKIQKELEDKWQIKIARRTITKYRQALGISSTSERRLKLS